MERPIRTKVDHGSASCRRYGCNNPECVDAAYRAAKISRYRTSKGETLRGVSCDSAALHGKALIDAGMLVKDIARLSGVCTDLVGGIISGRKERASRKTVEAILGVPIPTGDLDVRQNGLVDATGAMRRLRALAVQGFSITFLAKKSKLSHLTIEEIRRGVRPLITGVVNRKIADLCEAYWNADPVACGMSATAAERAKRWASEQNWAPLAAWDDDAIRDPEAQPQSPDIPSYITLTEDARWLMNEYGLTAKEAAGRLGLSPRQLGNAFSQYNRAAAKGEVPA